MKQSEDKVRFRKGVIIAIAVVFVLLGFTIVKGFYADDLQHFGIRPRTLNGILGIFTAPIVHGDLNHLLSNVFPLLFSIPVLFYFYYKRAAAVLITVYLLSGFWVWLIARNAVHLGASGIVYGLLSFLFSASLLKKDRAGMAMAAAIIFLYGAPIVAGFFPTPGISFEAHISGAVAGLFMAVFLKYYEKDNKVIGKKSSSGVNSTAHEEITFKYYYKSLSDSDKK